LKFLDKFLKLVLVTQSPIFQKVKQSSLVGQLVTLENIQLRLKHINLMSSLNFGKWLKVNLSNFIKKATGNAPSSRAAHAAVAVELN